MLQTKIRSGIQFSSLWLISLISLDLCSLQAILTLSLILCSIGSTAPLFLTDQVLTFRRVEWPYSLYYNTPRHIHCGTVYILGALLICGRMGLVPFVSRIDMIWAPLPMADLVQECEYHPSFLTDHQYLLVKCCFWERLVVGPGVWKFNTS